MELCECDAYYLVMMMMERHWNSEKDNDEDEENDYADIVFAVPKLFSRTKRYPCDTLEFVLAPASTRTLLIRSNQFYFLLSIPSTSKKEKKLLFNSRSFFFFLKNIDFMGKFPSFRSNQVFSLSLSLTLTLALVSMKM